MILKKTIELNGNNSLGIGHLVHCCGKYQQVLDGSVSDGGMWLCAYCEKPLLANSEDRIFAIGEDVTI